MKWYLDLLLNSSSAGTEVSAGTHRSFVRCNWKIPAEQFGSDNWHFQGVHGSMGRLGRRNEDPNRDDSFHAWTDAGTPGHLHRPEDRGSQRVLVLSERSGGEGTDFGSNRDACSAARS